LDECADLDPSYPLYVNVWKKDVMDTHRATRVGVEPPSDKALQLEAQAVESENKRDEAAAEVEIDSK
jgi:FHS family L-fucose permease-like MFS transporter